MAEPAVQTFGKYQILERIATGGMAEIYKARLEGIGGFQRTFAIKRVLPHLSQNADYVAMLVDEAKVAGLLSHANIVQILDLGQVDGVWFIAMEYVHGRDLGAVLERCRERGLVLPVPHACFVAVELLKGLEYAHQRQVMRGGRPVPLNIIHRDVSPPNILLAFQGEVKLTDFGIARASLKVMETQAGVIKGRFDYMSPEQALGSRDLDQRSDLFSVGVVLYEMLTGHHPFRGANELDTLEAVRDGVYEPVSTHNPDIPFALETIVDRALRANREERYPSATAFKEALDKFFHDAGFLFTQDTLGTYVQGLFPEAVSRKASRAPVLATGDNEALDPPPTEEVQLQDLEEEEGPTRVMDAAAIRAQAPEAFRVPASEAPPPTEETHEDPKAADYTEEATLIQPNLLAQERALRSAAFAAADDEEAETVVDREALASLPPGPASIPPSAPRTPQVPPPLVGAADLGPPPSGSGSLVAMVLLGMAMLLMGVAIGAGLGVGGALVVAPPGPSAAARAARLEVAAPPGAEVRVNGVLVGAGVAVAPEQPQAVEVRVGDARWSGTVTVARGETRILVVQAFEASGE